MQAAANKSFPSGQAGFTLVEVICSMFVMAMVFTAAFGSYFLGMRIVENAREEVRASQIIQSELERLRTMNWTQIEGLRSFDLFQPQGTFVKQYSNNYIAYRYVTGVFGMPMKRVEVYVWWRNSDGMWTRQGFNTVITRGGLNDYYYRDI